MVKIIDTKTSTLKQKKEDKEKKNMNKQKTVKSVPGIWKISATQMSAYISTLQNLPMNRKFLLMMFQALPQMVMARSASTT